MWHWYDQPHGVKTSWEGVAKELKVWDFLLLLLLGWNMKKGARNDDERYESIKLTKKKILAKRPDQVPLFGMYAADMVYELETFGGVQFPREKVCLEPLESGSGF